MGTCKVVVTGTTLVQDIVQEDILDMAGKTGCTLTVLALSMVEVEVVEEEEESRKDELGEGTCEYSGMNLVKTDNHAVAVTGLAKAVVSTQGRRVRSLSAEYSGKEGSQQERRCLNWAIGRLRASLGNVLISN